MGIPVRAEAFVFLQDDFCGAPSCQLLTSVTPKAKSGINPRTIKASHAAQLIVSGFMAVRATCCQREGTPGFQNCFAHSLLRKKTAGAAKNDRSEVREQNAPAGAGRGIEGRNEACRRAGLLSETSDRWIERRIPSRAGRRLHLFHRGQCK